MASDDDSANTENETGALVNKANCKSGSGNTLALYQIVMGGQQTLMSQYASCVEQ